MMQTARLDLQASLNPETLINSKITPLERKFRNSHKGTEGDSPTKLAFYLQERSRKKSIDTSNHDPTCLVKPLGHKNSSVAMDLHSSIDKLISYFLLKLEAKKKEFMQNWNISELLKVQKVLKEWNQVIQTSNQIPSITAPSIGTPFQEILQPKNSSRSPNNLNPPNETRERAISFTLMYPKLKDLEDCEGGAKDIEGENEESKSSQCSFKLNMIEPDCVKAVYCPAPLRQKESTKSIMIDNSMALRQPKVTSSKFGRRWSLLNHCSQATPPVPFRT